MSDPIGPGDWVECIDAKSRTFAGTEDLIRQGAVYLVLEVGISPLGSPGLGLKGVVGFGYRGWFFANRFRPVHRPGKSTLIRDLLTKVPEGVEA